MTALAGAIVALGTLALGLGQSESVVAFKVGPNARVRTDALARAVFVEGEARVKATSLCPDVGREGNAVKLTCITRKIRARILDRGGERVLEIEKLRGAPALDGDATLPVFGYPPEEFGIGGPCPGDTKTANAECDFQRGAWKTAIPALASLAATSLNAHANLRLGDAAYYNDELELAARLWDQAGSVGPFSRLAAVRICDLMGDCEDATLTGLPYPILSPAGVAPAVSDEIILRHARMLAYDDELEEAVALLIDNERACARAPTLCMRIVLQRMREAEGPCPDGLVLATAVAQYLSDQVTTELSLRVAEEAAAFGASTYGANILSTAALAAPVRERERPLLRAAELYTEGGDLARAAVLVRFAEARLAPLQEKARWSALSARLGRLSAPARPAPKQRPTTTAPPAPPPSREQAP